jgi:hypothetical protein
MKYADIYTHMGALEAFGKRDLPFNTSLGVAKRIAKCRELLKLVEEERVKLVKKFGKLDEAGEVVRDERGNVSLEDANGFRAAFEELTMTEVEESLKPLPMKNMPEDLQVPSGELASLITLGLIVPKDDEE